MASAALVRTSARRGSRCFVSATPSGGEVSFAVRRLSTSTTRADQLPTDANKKVINFILFYFQPTTRPLDLHKAWWGFISCLSLPYISTRILFSCFFCLIYSEPRQRKILLCCACGQHPLSSTASIQNINFCPPPLFILSVGSSP